MGTSQNKIPPFLNQQQNNPAVPPFLKKKESTEGVGVSRSPYSDSGSSSVGTVGTDIVRGAFSKIAKIAADIKSQGFAQVPDEQINKSIELQEELQTRMENARNFLIDDYFTEYQKGLAGINAAASVLPVPGLGVAAKAIEDEEFKPHPVLQAMMSNTHDLANYVKGREHAINDRVKELREEQTQHRRYENEYGTNSKSYKPRLVITNAPEYNRIESEIGILNKYLGDIKASATEVAGNQIIEKHIQDGHKAIGYPELIGRDILKAARDIPGLGITDDQATALEQKNANLGDVPRSDLEELGLNAWRKYLIANPKLRGREGYIMDLMEWEKSFDRRHFEITAARVRHKIGATLKRKAGFGSSIFRPEPTPPEIIQAANESDLSDTEMEVFNSYVLPVELRNIGTDIPMSGFFNKLGEGISGSTENLLNIFRSDTERLQEGLNRELDTKYDEVGEWQRGKSELEMLKKKEKEKPLTTDEQNRKIELGKYVNVRNWWDKFWDGSGDLTGQVLYQATLARAFGGLGNVPYVGVVARGDIASLMTTSFLTSYDLHAQQAVMLMPRKDQELNRKLYSFTMAGMEGLSERIFQDTKILDAFKKDIAPGVVKLTRRITNDGITAEAAKSEFKALLTNKLKPYASNFVKAEVQEGTEEAVVDVAEGMAASIFGGREFEADKVFGNAIHTFLTTMAYSPFVSHLAAVRDTRQGAYGKSGLYKMAEDPAPYKRAVNALLLADKINQDEANEKIRIISTAHQIIKDMPGGTHMDYPARTNYMLHRLNEAILNDKIKGATDPIEKESLIAQRDASSQKVREIYDGAVKFDNDLNEIDPNDEKNNVEDPPDGNTEVVDNGGDAIDILSQVDALAEFQPNQQPKPKIRVQLKPGGGASVVEHTSELGRSVMNAYGLEIDQVDPADNYTVFVPDHLGSLATFLGAEVIPIGDGKKVQVNLSGQQLLDLRDQEIKSQTDAISQENAEKVILPESGSAQHLRPEERERQLEEKGSPVPSANRSDSDERSQEQAIPKPRFRVARNDAGEYTVIKPEDETTNLQRQEEPTDGSQTGEPGTQGPQGENQGEPIATPLEGVYSFSETVDVPISELNQSQKYRKGRPFIESVRDQSQKPTNRPVLAYRAPDGKTYVLDGRAKIAAAQLRGETSVPVKYLKGTEDQARQVGELSRNVPSRKVAQLRADRVSSRVSESLEEEVLQGMLTALRTGNPLFSIRSFKRYITSIVTRDPRRKNAGKQTQELLQLIRTKIIGEGGADLDMYVQSWEARDLSGEEWMAKGYSTNEQDMINQIVDIVTSYSTKEKIIERLEVLQGIEHLPLVDSMLPLRMSEEDAVFVSLAGLNNILEEIIFNADSINLNEQEAEYLRQMVSDNSNPDGTNLNIDSMAYDLMNSDVPEAKSIFKKLTQYADTIEKTTPKSVGDTGGEAVLGEQENEGDDLPLSGWRPSDVSFSRAAAYSQERGTNDRLTAKQARKVARGLSRAFKGLKVFVDRKKFADALKNALNESRQPLEVQGLIDDLQKAQDILSSAQRAFNNKQKELNATAAADQEDLFGERKSQQGNKLFDERAQLSARESAIQSFRDRLNTARENVNKIQAKLTEAIKKGGTNQGVMFSKDQSIVAGIADTDGNVYLNPDEVRASTPIHEIGGHMLTRWAKSQQPELFAKIMQSAQTAPEEIKAFVRKYYTDIDEGSEDFLEEVFATAMGWDTSNIGRTMAIADKSAWQSFKDFVTSIWDQFVDFLAEKGIIDPAKVRVGFDPKDFESMTVSDFTNLAGELMFSGRRISAPQDQSNVRASGADYSFLRDEDFVYDYYNNIVGVRPEVQLSIAAEKQAIRAASIANGTYMKAPDGTLSSLTEDQWLTTKTVRFQEWDKGGLQDIFAAISVPPGNPHAIINEMAKDPLRQGEVLAFIENQSQTTSELAGLMDVIGLEAADLYERFKEKKGTVLRGYNGEPRVFYHGTNRLFTAFQQPDIRGNFFSSDPDTASGYATGFGNRTGAMVIPVFLKGNRILEIDQPVFDAQGNESFPGRQIWRDALGNEELNGEAFLRAEGYDGIVWGLGSGFGETVAIFNDGHIKSALSNTTFSNESNDFRFQRIGEASNLTHAQRDNLNQAKEMESVNMNADSIFFATGWFRGIDGDWRYELPNSNVRFSPPKGDLIVKTKLRDVLDYPELYFAHPELQEMDIYFGPRSVLNGAMGLYNHKDKVILVANDQADEGMYFTTRHEVQHALQDILGFEFGANVQVAEDYYNRKLGQTKSLISKFESQLKRLRRINSNQDSPEFAMHFKQIEYLEEHIARQKAQLEDFVESKPYWLNFFYYKYAGERESFAVEARAKLPDDVRVILFPNDVNFKKETVIMYRDQQLLKPISSYSKVFTDEGQLASDKAVIAKKALKSAFSVIPGDNSSGFDRGLNMWKSTLELAIEMQNRGHDKRVFLTSDEFLSIFGVRTYQQLPADILRIVESIWNLNPTQQQETLKAVSKAMQSKGDKKEAFTKELGKVRRNIIEAQNVREKKATSVTEDRPETQARVSSILTDIANGKTDDEIIEERRSEIGGLDDAAEKRLRRKIAEERVGYQEFEQAVRDQIARISQTGDMRYMKQMHLRMMQSKYAGTPAFKRLSDEVISYERTSKKSATDRAREIVEEAGIDVALQELQKEAASNSAMVPVLAGAIMEKLKVRKDRDAQQKVLEIMYQYSHQAGLNLNMIGAFYHMLSMSDATGKINFFVRVKNSMLSKFYDRMKAQGLNSEPFRAVRDIQADVISKARGDTTFAKRIEKLVKNLKGC